MGEGVALVYPYFREADPVRKLFAPLGIAYLSSQVQALGIPAFICDCTFETFQRAVERIAAADPSIVGIYVMISMSRNALALLRELRQRLPGTLFAAGGPLPTLYPDRFAREFDLVFRGEADLTFARFCRDYHASGCTPASLSRLPLSSYPGIYLQTENGVASAPAIHNPAAVLDRLPLPDRSGPEHRLYQQFWQDAAGCRPAGIIITRGCPWNCDFCSKPVWGSVFRKPSLDRVFLEIAEIGRLGYDQLWIADDSFTLDLAYLREFCRRKVHESPEITWTCLSRVDRLDREVVDRMHQAGCVRVYLGLESGSDETLRLMGKRATVRDGREAVRLFAEAGIETAGFFIVGYPGETMASVEETLAHALSLPLDEISINVPYPLPGSPLFDRVADVDPEDDWDAAGKVRFMYRSEFDEAVLKGRIEEAMERFARSKEERDRRRGLAMRQAPSA
ncbi:MAG: B12-binding domain-containing radical SAM protein [Methanomicrobiaceae archaeon]|nr:B12-binding domain-containing radical SAM protein [Methanomicrobiaceae archaeon]MDD5420254.1 radical SAM protein [Methanomicrobiaceae archaeon]